MRGLRMFAVLAIGTVLAVPACSQSGASPSAAPPTTFQTPVPLVQLAHYQLRQPMTLDASTRLMPISSDLPAAASLATDEVVSPEDAYAAASLPRVAPTREILAICSDAALPAPQGCQSAGGLQNRLLWVLIWDRLPSRGLPLTGGADGSVTPPPTVTYTALVDPQNGAVQTAGYQAAPVS